MAKAAISRTHGVSIMETREHIAKISKKRGHKFQGTFCKAVDRLHADGFITELWVDKKNQIITLRWVKNGAKWHVTTQGMRLFSARMEQLGQNANAWCSARERGTGNEQNYAVYES